MKTRGATEERVQQRVCGQPIASDDFRVAASRRGHAQPRSHTRGKSHRIADLALVESGGRVREGHMTAQEPGRFAWFWAFGWRRDS